MKNEKGMSYITLVILIVVIAFVIFATIHFVRLTIEKSQLDNLETDMLQIQGKVKIIVEEDNMDKDNDKLKGRKVEEYKELSGVKKLLENGIIAEDEENFSKYYFFDSFDLEQIKLDNVKLDKGFYLINYATNEVIYSEGITVEGQTYYKLSELKDLSNKKENNNVIEQEENTVVEEPKAEEVTEE